MRIISQTRENSAQIFLALSALGNNQTQAVRMAVAYVTRAGCERLFNSLVSNIGQTRWSAIPKTFVTSFDYGITEPAALSYLKQMDNSKVYIRGVETLQNRRLYPSDSFHPKMYIFDMSTMSSVAIGSANLSDSALTTNAEAIIVSENVSELTQINNSWGEFLTNSTLLTTTLLSRYRNIRQRYISKKGKAKLPREKPHIPPVNIPNSGQLAAFYNEISTGSLDLQNYEKFWVEAGTMSSGGSHNQLELPRGGNIYFGFDFTQYDNQHRTIGCPNLYSRNITWTDKPLTWHGHNAMERINLPTITQGGYDYVNTIVHFTRLDNSVFELQVFPWQDSIAQMMRDNSQNQGLVFKLGINASRICGLY